MRPFRKKPAPQFPEAMVKEAVRNPNGWDYSIDAQVGSQWGEVPSFAIIGGRKVDANGILTDEFKANPNYDIGKVTVWIASRPHQGIQ